MRWGGGEEGDSDSNDEGYYRNDYPDEEEAEQEGMEEEPYGDDDEQFDAFPF